MKITLRTSEHFLGFVFTCRIYGLRLLCIIVIGCLCIWVFKNSHVFKKSHEATRNIIAPKLLANRCTEIFQREDFFFIVDAEVIGGNLGRWWQLFSYYTSSLAGENFVVIFLISIQIGFLSISRITYCAHRIAQIASSYICNILLVPWIHLKPIEGIECITEQIDCLWRIF